MSSQFEDRFTALMGSPLSPRQMADIYAECVTFEKEELDKACAEMREEARLGLPFGIPRFLVWLRIFQAGRLGRQAREEKRLIQRAALYDLEDVL